MYEHSAPGAGRGGGQGSCVHGVTWALEEGLDELL